MRHGGKLQVSTESQAELLPSGCEHHLSSVLESTGEAGTA